MLRCAREKEHTLASEPGPSSDQFCWLAPGWLALAGSRWLVRSASRVGRPLAPDGGRSSGHLAQGIKGPAHLPEPR